MRATSLRIECFLVSLALIGSVALAGPNRWTSSGPEGPRVDRIFTDPDEAAVAYAVTYNAGIFKTSNGGQSWRPANEGLPDVYVLAFLIQPDAPSTLFAATATGIFISTDAGEHWRRQAGIEGSVTTFAFDSSSGVLYSGTGSGVSRSADGGRTWEKTSSTLDGWYINALAVSPDGTLYATARARGASFLFSSRDHARTWTEVTKAPIADFVTIDRDSSAIYVLSRDISVSTDGGNTWKTLPIITGSPAIDSIIPAGAGHLYAATGLGVYEYTDLSQKWRLVGSSLIQRVHALAITSSTPHRFYAALDIGVMTNVETEADWTPANAGLPGAFSNDVAILDSDPAVVFAATSVGLSSKTADDTSMWQKSGKVPQPRHVESPRGQQDTLYVSTYNSVLKTNDAGATWKTIAASTAFALAVAPSKPATVYAALSDSLAKSTNGGATWTNISSGLPLGYFAFYYGFTANSIAVAPTDDSKVYVATPDAVYKTTDGGTKWTIAASQPNAAALAIEPNDPSVVYAASGGAGILRSSDDGTTWTPAGLIDKHVLSLTIGGAPSALYAGTTDGHLYRSDDRGDTWNAVEDGLTRSPIYRLAITGSGDRLYAATSAGVYEYNIVNRDIQIAPEPDDPLRVARLVDQWTGAQASSGLVIPVVGTARGIGAIFTTQLTLSNDRQTSQDVLLAYLPEIYSGSASTFRFTLPPSSTVTMDDIHERLAIDGIGSLVVIGINGSDQVDADANINASARIWMHPRDGRAPFSQSIEAVRAALFAGHSHASASGLEHDATSRTNVGIVNLSSDSHQFTVQVNGERASSQFTLGLPPFTFEQVAVPDADYGSLSLEVFADAETARWMFYGSTINNSTSEAHTTVGTP
jgi:photosystem II stability/assembly factor-like uncharacterized protein